ARGQLRVDAITLRARVAEALARPDPRAPKQPADAREVRADPRHVRPGPRAREAAAVVADPREREVRPTLARVEVGHHHRVVRPVEADLAVERVRLQEDELAAAVAV